MPKYIFILIISILHLTDTEAAIKWNSTYQKYIDRYKDVAIEQMLTYGIPASITLSQGLLESGAGTSRLATQGNNHFGIKCHNWSGGTMYMDDDQKDDCFRTYNSAHESFIDHSKFLQSKRYQKLFTLNTTDYKGWARGLKSCGYATNPQYADKLIEIIELYKLYQYDTQTTYNRAHLEDKDSKPGNVEGLATLWGLTQKTHKTKKTKKSKAELLGKIVKNHRIYSYNDNTYIIAQQGETYRSVAMDVNVSYRRLAKYNEKDKNSVLAQGEIVYLQKKKTKAAIKYKGYLHTVMAGQSMHDISQMYGIRLSSLYKKNNLPDDYMPMAGDKLRVY